MFAYTGLYTAQVVLKFIGDELLEAGLRLIVYPAFFSEDARGKLPPTGIKKPCDINCKAFKLLEPDTFTNTQTL